jgi:hypothetical protein
VTGAEVHLDIARNQTSAIDAQPGADFPSFVAC